MRLENEKQKWEVLKRKSNPRDRKKRISENMTCKKRKIKWRLRETASIEMGIK